MSLLSWFSVGLTFDQSVSRFNSNVSYSGLLHAVTQDVSIQTWDVNLTKFNEMYVSLSYKIQNWLRDVQHYKILFKPENVNSNHLVLFSHKSKSY